MSNHIIEWPHRFKGKRITIPVILLAPQNPYDVSDAPCPYLLHAKYPPTYLITPV